jgi:putative tricarboxylic transport membrane protein
MRSIVRELTAFTLAIFAGVAAAQAPGGEWKPGHTVDIVVGSAPGGSPDRTARLVQKILQGNAIFPSITVTNRPGGGNTVAWAFMAQHAGDAHYIATYSPTLITNRIMGVSQLNYADFTPLNILFREYVVVAVRTESPISSGKDLVERLKRDATAVSFCFATARGNHNHIALGMLLKAAGADAKKAKMVINNSGGEALTMALGGHVDVLASTPAGALSSVQGGKLRVLGVTSAQRLPQMPNVPTFREQGIDAVFFAWRGFIAPKGLTPAQIAFWDQTFAKLVQADEWKKDLEANVWTENFMASAETRKHLDHENEVTRAMLVDLGVVGK